MHCTGGIWLRTHPVENSGWYKTLSSTLNIGSAVQNVKNAVDEVLGRNNVCLTMKKNLNGGPMFELKSLACNETRSVVCRKSSLSSNYVPKPSRFPCMAEPLNDEKGVERKKRATVVKNTAGFDQFSLQGINL